MKGELDLGDVAAEDDTPEDETDGDHGPVLERFREALSERVKDVRVTRRLSTSPACLVSEEYELSRHHGANPRRGGPEGRFDQAHPGDQPRPSDGRESSPKRPIRPGSRTGRT